MIPHCAQLSMTDQWWASYTHSTHACKFTYHLLQIHTHKEVP